VNLYFYLSVVVSNNVLRVSTKSALGLLTSKGVGGYTIMHRKCKSFEVFHKRTSFSGYDINILGENTHPSN
jgi:hypothetical protein